MEKSEIETIYRKYFHDVFLYIRALSENESLAEEITQETFLKAMNNIEKFDGRKDIRAWLFVIAKNTYFRYCRRNKIYVGEEFSEIMQDSMQDTSPAVLDQIVQDETVRNLKRYAELIPEPYREVFHLRIYGELSFEQIGKCYQKSAGWARVTYHLISNLPVFFLIYFHNLFLLPSRRHKDFPGFPAIPRKAPSLLLRNRSVHLHIPDSGNLWRRRL